MKRPKVTILSLWFVAFVVTTILVSHKEKTTRYQPLKEASGSVPLLRVSARRAGSLVDVERALSPSAGAQVLVFAKRGKGQAEFSWAAEKSGASYRAWARVRCRGSLRFLVENSAGEKRKVDRDLFRRPTEWLWLDLGTFPGLESGRERLRLTGGRGSKWELHELVITSPEEPAVAPALPLSMKTGALREFGDHFDRSPDHGLGAWRRQGGSWEIQFTLDPNRIPMQYSLHGKSVDGTEGALWVDGPEWLGSRTEASVFLEENTTVGIGLETAEGMERFLFSTKPGKHSFRVAPRQWHRLTLEAWGWTRRFLVDGKEISVRHDVVPVAHRPGLLIVSGEARFDDVRVDEITWCAEDAKNYRIPWKLSGEDAAWEVRRGGRGAALRGKHGELQPPEGMASIREAVLWHGDAPARILGGELVATAFPDGTVYRTETASNNWRVVSPGDFSRLAIASWKKTNDGFRIGPYRFDTVTIPSPGDYVDFTPKEWEEMRTSPEADKLLRKPRQTRVVGKSNQYAIWGVESGRWRVHDGALRAYGRFGRIRFWQEFDGGYTLRFRVRLEEERSRARVLLGEMGGAGVSVGFYDERTEPGESDLSLPLEIGKWTDCEVVLGMEELSVRIRKETESGDWSKLLAKRMERGLGGGLLLENEGRGVCFDDVEVVVPRHLDGQDFYAFDRRETDWRRDGLHWVDHGGVSCALASNWISLMVPQEKGMLWHKKSFSGDVMVATNIEENTEWVGWSQEHSHIHHPFDNIIICLGENRDLATGYRLEVNSRQRSATVLYRNDREVAVVPQDANFPIQYHGGHAPYRPRRNRVMLVRQGARIQALINGVEVLSFVDENPLTTRLVGIGGYQTRVNFSRIMVRGFAE